MTDRRRGRRPARSYLQRAGPLAPDRDRVLARDAAAVRLSRRPISSLASQIAITALFALSLDLILGYAGIVSLGHAAFFGFGAYTAGLLSKCGLGRAALRAAARGARRRAARLSDELHHRALPPSRADHDHARASACCCTRSPTARAGSPAAPTACRACACGRCFGIFQLRSLRPHRLRLFARSCCSCSFLVARRLINSPFGLSLRGIRENARRMPAIGAPSRVAHPHRSTPSPRRSPASPARCWRRPPRPSRSTR